MDLLRQLYNDPIELLQYPCIFNSLLLFRKT